MAESIKHSEYEINWQPGAGAFQSPNRAQNMRISYYLDGFVVEPRREYIRPWHLAIRLVSHGKKNGESKKVGNGKWKHQKNKGEVKAENLIFEYTNTEEGMRQNFHVQSKPPGHGNLTLVLSLEYENLTHQVNENGTEIQFQEEGVERVKYSDLNVFDATGKRLNSRFEDLGRNQVSITVDDENAQYPVLVDPLTSVNPYPWGPVNGNPAFGLCVSGMGIVSSGTHGGVLVAAPNFDNGQTDEGRVFAYIATFESLPSTADWYAESDQAYAHFGAALADVYDVNGDNYADILIGAPDYDDNSLTDNGKVFLFAGSYSGFPGTSPSTPTYASWTKSGDQNGGQFGYSICGLANANYGLDSYGDFAIGQPGWDNTSTDASDVGRVHVFIGTSTWPSSTATVILENTEAGARFGSSVASAGTANNDVYTDLIVGAPERKNGGSLPVGAAYVYHGGYSTSAFNTTPATSLYGTNSNSKFGFSVSGGDDVNGDSYADVIVGAPYEDGGSTDNGKVYLYNGSSSGISTSLAWSATGGYGGDAFGYSVALGPINDGDTYADILVGAPFHDLTSNAPNAGATYFYRSNSGNSFSLDQTILGGETNGNYGIWVIYGRQIRYNHGGFVTGTPNASSGGGTYGRFSAYGWTP